MICSDENCTSENIKAQGMCKRCYDRNQARKRRLENGTTVKLGDFCKRGHKVEGGNAQLYKNSLGNDVLRCRACNMLGNRKKNILGGMCINGHDLTPDNVYHAKQNGNPYLSCLTCKRARDKKRWAEYVNSPEYQRKQIERTRAKQVQTNKDKSRAERYDVILSGELDGTQGKYTGLNYLKLNKRSQRAWEPLETKFDRTKSKCYKNPGPYIDYDEEDVPFASQAYKLCEGCPMLVECARFAAAYKPTVGVWGGEVYIDGKVVR
jgi:hypothetical protein